MRMDKLELGRKAVIAGLDASMLSEAEMRRLRAIGLNEGAEVEPLHHGVLFSRDPIAMRVGRMTLAIRAAQAAAIEVNLE